MLPPFGDCDSCNGSSLELPINVITSILAALAQTSRGQAERLIMPEPCAKDCQATRRADGEFADSAPEFKECLEIGVLYGGMAGDSTHT